MGNFNAHFSKHRVEMDYGVSLLLSMSNTLGLNVLNWLTQAYGKFTWSSGSKKSTLDYISTSQWWVEHTRNLLIDKEGWFDMGSDHNLILWKFDLNKACQGGSKQEQDKRRKVKKAALEMEQKGKGRLGRLQSKGRRGND